MAAERWREAWQVLHTPVAVETQANVEYVQNLVIRPLTDDAFPYGGIVEECFPDAAMDDANAFFDAVGDDARLAANLARMMESCARFIEVPGGIHVLPTSQYDYRRVGAIGA